MLPVELGSQNFLKLKKLENQKKYIKKLKIKKKEKVKKKTHERKISETTMGMTHTTHNHSTKE